MPSYLCAFARISWDWLTDDSSTQLSSTANTDTNSIQSHNKSTLFFQYSDIWPTPLWRESHSLWIAIQKAHYIYRVHHRKNGVFITVVQSHSQLMQWLVYYCPLHVYHITNKKRSALGVLCVWLSSFLITETVVSHWHCLISMKVFPALLQSPVFPSRTSLIWSFLSGTASTSSGDWIW